MALTIKSGLNKGMLFTNSNLDTNWMTLSNTDNITTIFKVDVSLCPKCKSASYWNNTWLTCTICGYGCNCIYCESKPTSTGLGDTEACQTLTDKVTSSREK